MKKFARLYQGGMVGLLGVMLCLTPVVAGAATFRGGDQEDVVIEAPVADDLYVAGNRVVIKEDIAEDVMVAGQAIAVSSVIGEDVYAVGQFVRLEGTIEDDAHVASNALEIEGRIEGDVLAVGQSIVIAESAVVTGDVLAVGQSIVIAGEVQGKVQVASDHLQIKSGATVGGDVSVYGQAPQIQEGAVVEGEVQHRQPTKPETVASSALLLHWVQGVLGTFLLVMVLAVGLPNFMRETVTLARKKPGASLLTGFVWLVLVLPLVILLFISILGIPLALATVFMTGLVIIAGSAVAALLIGQWLLKRLDKKHSTEKQLIWPQALLGAAVYEAMQLLGPPGWVVSMAFLVWGMGALVQASWKKRSH